MGYSMEKLLDFLKLEPSLQVRVKTLFQENRTKLEADILIIGGTSLTVYPAAGLIDYYRGKKLVLINKSVTPMDSRADLVMIFLH
mgnify:CR=1 FL=1